LGRQPENKKDCLKTPKRRLKPFSDGMERVEFLFDLYEKAVNGQATP